MRLIAALDKNIPCWPETNHKLRRIDDSVGQFDLALAHVVREAGGQITVAEAYRRLSHPGRRDYRRLTIEKFLRMLRSVEYTVVEFKDPQCPIVRLPCIECWSFPSHGSKRKWQIINPLGRFILIHQRFDCLSQRPPSANATQSQGAKFGSSTFLQCRSCFSFETGAAFENVTWLKNN